MNSSIYEFFIKIIGIDYRYCNKLYLSFSMIPTNNRINIIYFEKIQQIFYKFLSFLMTPTK